MSVAIGPVLLLLASILLGAALLIAAFGVILWVSGQQGRLWDHETPRIAGGDGTTIAAPGK